MYDSTKYMLERRKKKKKKILFTWTLFENGHGLNAGVSPVSLSHYRHSSLWTPCLSTAWLGGGTGGVLAGGLLNEQHFHLTRLWVYFIRWLLLIGAFWLYSARLGSSWAG